ncbi:MAG: outer membrane protein insertion porin family [Planctomycetota bacterium]|jgi:outer membrane protein insertion porin family
MRALHQRKLNALWAALLLFSALACRSTDELVGLKTELLNSPDKYDYAFKGVSSFSEGLLLRAANDDLLDFVEGGFRASTVDDAAYTMEGFYLDRGFPDAQVEYLLQKPEGEKIKVHFNVNEGPRCRLDEVTFQGNAAITSSELKTLISGPTTGLFGTGSTYFVESEAQAARSSIESLYYQRGHIEVRVTGPEILIHTEGKKANLHYRIAEGPRFGISKISVAAMQDEETASIEADLQRYIGHSFFPRLTYEISAVAGDTLARRGYPDATADATTEVNLQSGAVELVISITSGQKVYVSGIVVKGNERTRDSFILGRLGIAVGDLFHRGAERNAFSELYGSGLFDSVEINLQGEGPQRELHVTVEESETLSIYGEVGYGSFERARVLFGVSEDNLFGTGRSLRFEGKLAEYAREAHIFFTDPYTINSQNVLGVDSFVEERKLVSFDSLEYGVGFSLTRRLTDQYRNIYGYEYRISKAQSVEVEVPGLDDELQADANISALYLTNVYDSRDTFFLPREGSWFRLRSELAPPYLGSELEFVRLDGRLVSYLPIDEKDLLAWTIRLGTIAPTGETDAIPLQERFFNGGQNTVRSFKEDELGPTDANGKPIGGEAYSVLSLEYRHKLFGNFTGVLFADTGNVSLDYKDTLRFANLRYAYGPGLRWLLPVGPVRLDWGINPNPRAHEDDWVLQFSLGVAF